MKHIIKMLIIVTAFSLAGCADLDETLRTGITAKTYFSTAEGFEDLAKSMYGPLQVKYGWYCNVWDHGTDIFEYGSGAREYLNTYDGGLNPSATSRNWYSIWVEYYKGINLANSVIGRADNVDDLSDARKKTLVAEARFMRALFYHHLVQTHGGVHLTLEETFGVETEANRTPENEIWQAVIEDLEIAAADLPVVNDVPRATSGAAKHLLARVNLIIKDYPEAAKWAVEVINSGDYELIDSYYTLWDPYESHSGKGYNKETIFGLLITPNAGTLEDHRDVKARRYAARVRSLPGMQATFCYGNEVSRHRPTPFYVHEVFNYDPTRTDVPNQWNDERFSATFKTAWYYNNPKTLPAGRTIGDTAVFFPTEKRFDDMSDAEAAAFHGGRFRMYRTKEWGTELWPSITQKFRMMGDETPDMSLALIPYGDPTWFWRTEPIFRLGETYLIAAEAYMYMGGAANLQIAANYFNEIRKRAEAPGQTMPLITPAQLNIDEILNERHRELAGEYLTWYDLKRTGKLIERVKLYNNATAAANIKDFHLLRPIPQAQIDRCTNEYPQNPGY